MTPMCLVQGISIDETLTSQSLSLLYASGFSRIPVFSSGRGRPPVEEQYPFPAPPTSARQREASSVNQQPSILVPSQDRAIKGFVFIKDLLLLKGVERIRCRDLLLLFYKRNIIVDERTPLLTLLNFFKEGRVSRHPIRV